MDLIGSNDEELYTCHICKKSFDHIAALVLDEIIHKLNKKKSKRKKLNLTKKYCDICCRYYASLSSLNLHFKRTHLQSHKEDILTIYKEYEEFYRPNKKNAFFNQNIDDFTEFNNNNLPLELKYNQHRCLVCNYTCDNLNQFMEHESSHYKTNEKIDYFTTSTNSIDSNNEQNTNVYSTSRIENENMKRVKDGNIVQQQIIDCNCVRNKINNSINHENNNLSLKDVHEVSLQVLNSENPNNDLNRVSDTVSAIKKLNVSNKVNQQQYNLYECAPSTSKDNSINVCYKGITCAICKEQFTNGQELEIHANKKHMNFSIKLDINEVDRH